MIMVFLIDSLKKPEETLQFYEFTPWTDEDLDARLSGLCHLWNLRGLHFASVEETWGAFQ